jgi:dienelactone hydrolase
MPFWPDSGESASTYFSTLDGTQQPYRFYVPRRWRRRYPVVVCLHGFGGVMPEFSQVMRTWADWRGWLLLAPDGRGNQHFDGPGEDDVLACLADLDRRAPLDADRIVLHGASMGGHGALRLALRHPHRFAAVSAVAGWLSAAQWFPKWYAAPGELLPPPALAPLVNAASPTAWREHAAFLSGRLAFGTADDVNEPEDAEWFAAWLGQHKLLGPGSWQIARVAGGGHGAGGHWPAVGRLATRARRRWPTRLRSATLRHADLGWVRADRLIDPAAPAAIDLAWERGRATLTTTNVAELVLTPAAGPPLLGRGPVRLTVDGRDLGLVPPDESTAVPLAAGPGRLVKRRGLDGPIGEFFRAPFQVVRPTAGPDREAAERFCADWDAWFIRRGEQRTGPMPRPIPPEAADAVEHSLMVFGDLDSSPLMRRFGNWPGTLGVRPIPGGLQVGERQFVGARLGWWALHPAPWRPERLMLLCHGYQHSDIDPEVWPEAVGKDLESLPWRWPDVVVWDQDAPLRDSVQPPLKCLWDAWVWAGSLDGGWR